MTTALAQLVPQFGPEGIPDFRACARYYPGMDFLLYLQEDSSFRADRVDRFLTLLWHPQEDRLIGLKFKDWKLAFDRLKADYKLSDNDFLPLVKALELALLERFSEPGIAKIGKARLKQRESKSAKRRSIPKRSSSPAT